MKITLVAVFLATSSLTSTGTGTTTLMTSTTLPLTTTVTRADPRTVRFPMPDLATCRRTLSELQVAATNLHTVACDAE